jgi:hypothetical protein
VKFVVESTESLPMPDSPAVFDLSPGEVAALPEGGAKATVEGNVVIAASTPTWTNSPYRFKVALVVDGAEVWRPEGNFDKPATVTIHFTASADLVVGRGGRPRIQVFVSAPENWTYRSGQFGNPPDRASLRGVDVSLVSSR